MNTIDVEQWHYAVPFRVKYGVQKEVSLAPVHESVYLHIYYIIVDFVKS